MGGYDARWRHLGLYLRLSSRSHSLWPDYCDGTYPQYCSAESGIQTYGSNLTAIPSILRKYNPVLAANVLTIYANDTSLITHEWDKHATCYNTLKAHCQVTFPGGPTAQETAVLNYYGQIAHNFKAYSTYEWLKEAGVVPSNTTTYTLEQFQSALAKQYGAVPYVGCTSSGTKFDEVWYYAHVRGPLVGGQYVPTNSTTPSSCHATGIRYLPK